MDKITFCIPSKNNLRYLKTCISSIRENAFRKDHDIIVFVDSDEDGTVDWLKQIKEKYNLTYYINPELGSKLYGIGKAYDYCIEKSTTEIFMIFHADMMLGENADLKAYQHLKPKTVVCSTRIEPPLHPNNGEKILLDFGIWPEEFKKEQFNEFVQTQLDILKVTNGIFAPWMMYKEDFIILGGHDPILASAREDSDVFNRMKLADYTFIQPWNSLVYHLTGRGGQFQHGIITKEEENKSLEWKQLMLNSTKEFIRKWGNNVKHTELMEPIILPKYDIGFIVKNCNQQILQYLEPWCSTIYVDCDYKEYINQEQNNTSYDLSERIYPYDNEKQNYILIIFDGNKLTNESFNMIQLLPEIIHQTNDLGSFELDIFTIDIINLTTFENTLIHL